MYATATMRDVLVGAFGSTALEQIDVTGVNPADLERPCRLPLRLMTHGADVSPDHRARTFMLCGGQVLAAVDLVNRPPGFRCSYYLVLDDNDGQLWDAWRRRYAAGEIPFDSKTYHTARPNARLRLVVSA